MYKDYPMREWTMRLEEPVEVKVNVAGEVPRALNTLGLAVGAARSIWFLEDLNPGLPAPFRC
jgi:hypothetical protein